MIKSEERKETRAKKSEGSLRDLWYTVKGVNICIMGIPEGGEREGGTGSLSEETMAQNFPNLRKGMKIQI